jgi:hypothetical protein
MGSNQAPALWRESSGFCMHDPIDDAYDAWKQADAAARVLQCEVAEAWRRYDRGLGDPPSRDLLREMSWLRHVAGEKLGHAIELLHDTGIIPISTSAAPNRSRPEGPSLES